MARTLTQPSTKLLFSKARVACLSPDVLDHIGGGFQVGPNSYDPDGTTFCPLVPGRPRLTQYSPAR